MRRGVHIEGLRQVAIAFVAARLLVGLSAWLASTIGFLPSARPNNLYFMWDGAFYRDIAEHSYQGASESLRFFPLFALLGRGLGVLVGGPEIALMLVANLAAAAATLLLWHLVLDHTNDPQFATRCAVIATLFPSAAVLALPYAEGLVIAFGLGAALLVRRQRWALAIVLLYAAGLTRPTAVLLAVPMFVLALMDRPWTAPEEGAATDRTPLRRITAWAAVTVAPLVGTASYLAWLGWTGRPWRAPLDIQSHLRRSTAEPFTRVLRMIGDVASGNFRDVYNLAFVVVLLIAFGFAVAARYRIEWLAYTAAGLLIALASENVDSVGRYGFMLLPAWAVGLTYATKRRWSYIAWLVLSSVAFVAMTTQWFRGAVIP